MANDLGSGDSFAIYGICKTSRLGRKTHQAFGKSQGFSELNNKVQESVSGIKVIKSFGYQEDELQSFQDINNMTFKKNMTTMKYDVMFDPWFCYLSELVMFVSFDGAVMVSAGQVTV